MHTRLITTLLPMFVAVTGLSAFGQQTPRPTAPARPLVRGPMLTEEDGSPVKGVHLARADVRAVVRGSLAEATMTLTFANTESRVLGGELVFPLPEGATVTGYGLEINGVMVDGVAVEKQQARVIYEKELHKRVDPGLVEQAAGNAFRTRLYPVPPGGTRSIKVQYVTDASATKDGIAVSLPMGWGGNVDRCSVRIDAPDATAQPTIASVKGDALTFKQTQHGYAAEGELKDAPDEIVIALPGLAERSVSIEKRIRPIATIEDLDEQAKGEDEAKRFERFEHYFVISDTPAKPQLNDAGTPVMKRVAILWDAGLSRADGDKSRELKLLDALLKQWPGAQADLVLFRDKAETPASFDLQKADGRGEIIERLSHLVYDGASDLGDLPLPKNLAGFSAEPPNGKTGDYDCILLFTGGMVGVGPETMRKAEVPLYAFCDEARANHAMLRQVCRESGGQYFNLKRMTDEQVTGSVGREAYSLVSIDSRPGEVVEVYPGPGTPVGGRVAISGKLLTPQATITLNYGFGKRVTNSQNFTLRAADATLGDLIPRDWAQQKIAELSMQPGVDEEALAKIGKQFNLVTPNTSLLVLETADQYVQYRVVPPKDRPEIYKEFLARIEENKSQERQTKEEKIQQVLAMWDGRVKWWEQKYEYPGDLRVAAVDVRQTELVNPAVPPLTPAAEPSAAPATAPANQTPAERRVQAAEDLRGTAQLEEIQKQANAYQARLVVNEALRARAANDYAQARDLFAQAARLDPGNGAAANGLRETLAQLGQQPREPAATAVRSDLEAQRSQTEFDFNSATASAKDALRRKDFGEADAEFEKARAAAAENPGILSEAERRDMNSRLAEIRNQTDSERTAAITRADESRQSAVADRLRRGVSDTSRGLPARAPAANGPVEHRRDSRSVQSEDLFDAYLLPNSQGTSVVHAGTTGGGAAIAVAPWDPATPYLAAMKAVPADKAYGVFLEQRKTFGKSPAFYLDCGDYLERVGQHGTAVRVLTDVAALRLADARLLRVAAHRLQQIGERDLAIDLFEKVLKMRPEEPQSHRDLALVLADRADASADQSKEGSNRDSGRIASDYARSLDLLNQVLVGQWDRFQEIELPCLMEANRIIAKVNRMKASGEIADVPIPLDPRFVKNLECDLRVVMTWDADNTDIDLWVTEPSGEKCFYSHNRTTIGGLLSRDFTDGYGPEEYCLRRLMPGKYAIQANFYGSRQQELTGPCTVQATVYADFGRPTERKQSLTLRLVEAKEIVDIGSVELGPKKPNGQ